MYVTMKAAVFTAVILGALASAVPADARVAVTNRPLIVTSQDHSLGENDDCEHFHTKNETSLPAEAMAVEERNFKLAGIDMLKVKASEEGGITVRGWDRPNARLTICKCAVAETTAQARDILGNVKVSSGNGDIFATGPAPAKTQAWWVHMILRVPKNANIDVTSSNGGIAIRNMSSRITARAKNGGISLAQCAGDQKITTENGGISLDKISGRLEANTDKGTISLKLRDEIVPALEAHTEDTGEIFCNVRGCLDGVGNWTADRKTLRIGTAAPTITLKTNGAPIMIEQLLTVR
jgi:hypothetical protein